MPTEILGGRSWI